MTPTWAVPGLFFMLRNSFVVLTCLQGSDSTEPVRKCSFSELHFEQKFNSLIYFE